MRDMTGHAPSGRGRPGTIRRPRAATFRSRLAGVLLCGALVLPAVPVHGQGVLSAIEADVDQIAQHARPSVVTIVAQSHPLVNKGKGLQRTSRMHSRVGSGFAVGPDEIVTTATVVLGAEKVTVVTDNRLQMEAIVAGLDPIHNVALLRVPGLRISPIAYADRPPRLGDWVVTLGTSYGTQPTQSVGTISYRWKEPRLTLLQLTNDVYPGNSGGPALNSRGELIGIVKGELGSPELANARTEGDRRPGSASFIIPLQDARPAIESLRKDGRVALGWMGVSTRAGFIESSTEPGLRVALGAIVESTRPGGPAQRLGLRPGDLIVAYDGERVEYPEQLARWVGATPPGTSVQLVWVRHEMRQEGRVVIGSSPTAIPSWTQPAATAGTSGDARPGVSDPALRARSAVRGLGGVRGQQDTAR